MLQTLVHLFNLLDLIIPKIMCNIVTRYKIEWIKYDMHSDASLDPQIDLEHALIDTLDALNLDILLNFGYDPHGFLDIINLESIFVHVFQE